MITDVLAKFSLLMYFLATLHYLALIVSEKIKESRVGRVGTAATALGFALHSAALIMQTVQLGHIPFSTARSSFYFFSWAIVLVYLFIETKYKMEIFGSFVLPLAMLTGIYASLLPKEIEPIISYNKGLFLAAHASTAFIGFASFSFSVCASIMYLIQERQLKSKQQGRFYYKLPSLQVLEKLSYKCTSIGFPIFTISLLLGVTWMLSNRSSILDWRFQEIWWVCIWLAYAVLLQSRFTFGWRGRRAAYVAIGVFVLACIPLLV